VKEKSNIAAVSDSTKKVALAVCDDNVVLPPEFDNRIEATLASLIAARRRPKRTRPTIGWVREVPGDLLEGPMPERSAECRRMMAELDGWLADLTNIPPNTAWSPDEILEAADPEQVAALCKALSLRESSLPPATQIVEAISSAAGNSFANLCRKVRKKRGLSYDVVVKKVAALEKLQIQPHESTAAAEEQIIRNRFVRLLADVSDAQRAELAQQFEAIAKEKGRSFYGEAGAGGVFMLAEASGFGVYMLASTVVGAVSKGLGLGLGFAFYTGMAQVLSAAIPGGLVAASALALYKATSPNKVKMTASVFHVGAMRAYLVDQLDRTKVRLRTRQLELLERMGPKEAEDSAPPLPQYAPRHFNRRFLWALGIAVVAVGAAMGGYLLLRA